MSQIYKDLTAGPVPPSVPTQFTADDATIGVPVANNFNLFSRSTSEDNPNGIQTTTDANGSANHYTELTNRLQDTVQTVGNTTQDLITFSLGATPGAFKFHFEVTAFESTTPAGLGYSIEASARTTGGGGATATIIATPDADEDEDVVLQADADWALIASGNDVILQVTGVTGLTLNWSAVGSYVFVS